MTCLQTPRGQRQRNSNLVDANEGFSHALLVAAEVEAEDDEGDRAADLKNTIVYALGLDELNR